MRFWILALACLIGCAHHEVKTVDFTVVDQNQLVYTAGGGGFIAFPASADAIKKELESLHVYAERCTEDCGVMAMMRYDDSVSQAELNEAVAVLVASASDVLNLPCYIRLVEDKTPRRVHLNALITVGTIKLSE